MKAGFLMDCLVRISRAISVRVMVGGAVQTEEYADSIGADSYASNAYGAVRTASDHMRDDEN